MTIPDLDMLDKLYSAASRGYSGNYGTHGFRARMVTRESGPANEVSGCDRDGNPVQVADFFNMRDTQLFIALHGVYPELAHELRTARAEIRRLRSWRCEQDCCYTMGNVADIGGSHCEEPCTKCRHAAEVRELDAEIAKLRAVLGKLVAAAKDHSEYFMVDGKMTRDVLREAVDEASKELKP